MKLTTDSIYRLDQLIQTAMIAGLKKIIIDGTNKKIRGIDEKQSVVVLTEQGVPDIGSYQIAINRPEQLYARLNLVKASGDLVVDATIAANNEDISILEISAGKTKAQFRCASNTAAMAIPTSILWRIQKAKQSRPTLHYARLAECPNSGGRIPDAWNAPLFSTKPMADCECQ